MVRPTQANDQAIRPDEAAAAIPPKKCRRGLEGGKVRTELRNLCEPVLNVCSSLPQEVSVGRRTHKHLHLPLT
jgi:hypothetical protein